jgi:3-oxoacyl-[acyl-carrier protein] reductase
MSETMQTLDFTGKTVLVAGGTSGLGNGIACRLRDQGADVHVWGTRDSVEAYDDDKFSDLEGMTFSQVDVTDSAAVAAYMAPFDTLDVLILSQGTQSGLEEYELEKFQRVMDVNVVSVMSVALRFKDALAAAGGSVVILSSMGSLMAIPYAPAYCASKHAITGLCRSLALGWARDGVRVNAIGPGVIPTRLASFITEDREYYDAVLTRNPMGRLGTREEVANAALFLASPMASYITGQTLIVDGGHTLTDTVNHDSGAVTHA